MHNLLQKLLLGCSAAAVVTAGSIESVLAQQAAAPNNNTDIEQVVVSASRITIAGYTQPTPVTVVGAAQLEKDALPTSRTRCVNFPRSIRRRPPSALRSARLSGTAGVNLVNLRNLGNCQDPGPVRRPARRGFQHHRRRGHHHPAVRHHTRVDVVTGGASAAWGSDAVAGVVNFVLNKNFTGLKASVEAGDTYGGLNREAKRPRSLGAVTCSAAVATSTFPAMLNIRPDVTLLVRVKNGIAAPTWFPTRPMPRAMASRSLSSPTMSAWRKATKAASSCPARPVSPAPT